MARNCKTCANAIFDSLWGEYKCAIGKGFVQPEQNAECETYKKGKPAVGSEGKLITDIPRIEVD